MKVTQPILRTVCFATCLAWLGLQASAQEAASSGGNRMADSHSMAGDAMDMQKAKQMATPAMMQMAKEQVMAGGMMANAMAMESTMAMTMQDEKTMKMVQEHAMAPLADGKPMISDEKIKLAIRKVFSDPAQFQALLQTLIMRQTAANMMAATPQQPAAGMMMIPAADMQAAKQTMMSDDAMTTMVAKEMLMNAMMMDKEISMAVKEAAMKPTDPAMAQMMKSESMMMAKEQMMKEPAMKMELAKEALARELAKPAAKMSGTKK